MNKAKQKIIQITTEQDKLTVTMCDNATVSDFLSLLPLTLTLRDYNQTEKVGDLPKRLNTKNTPAGHKPSIGDITYFIPFGNLAIFYNDFEYSEGLIILGHINERYKPLAVPGSVKVKIELVK